MQYQIDLAVLITARILLPVFCSAAPVHEVAPFQQQTCDFYNWCSAGSYCHSDAESSRCLPCRSGTYQPPPRGIVYRCRQHSICAPSPLDHDIDDGRTGLVIREGNRTHDTVCACEAGKYWNVTERGCREITKCKAGEGVSNIAVPEYDTKCTPCTPGTFSDQLSATQVCTVCTDCKALQRTTLEQCRPLQDTVCGALLITQTQPVDVVSSGETSPPKDDSRSVPTAEPENSAVTTTEAIGGKSADVLTRPAWTAITVVAVVVSLLTAAAIAAVHISRKRRRKATNNRPEPEGGSQLEHLMAGPNSTEQEDDAGEGEDEDEEEEEDGETDPKEAVSATGPPIQDTNDPKGNERDLSLKETNDGLEEIPTGPEGAEGTTFLKDARSPIQNTDDPEGNERDLHTKDATYGLEELTGDGDVTVTTSLSGEEEEEDLYKETSV